MPGLKKITDLFKIIQHYLACYRSVSTLLFSKMRKKEGRKERSMTKERKRRKAKDEGKCQE